MARKWGRGHKANYDTIAVKVPVPVLQEVRDIIERFHAENEAYLALPINGTWWDVLGVSRDASEREVKEAYRRLAKLYHPDRNLRRDAQERFTSLQRAYQEYSVDA